jgi:hypothetical protein
VTPATDRASSRFAFCQRDPVLFACRSHDTLGRSIALLLCALKPLGLTTFTNTVVQRNHAATLVKRSHSKTVV